ncbi:MAG: SdrD B-like domain-containing protein [Pseudomonadota bacterium]
MLFDTDVVLEKTVDTSAIADPAEPVPGEILTYTYTVRNQTDVTIFDIAVSENPPGVQNPGEPPNFSGTGTPPVVGAPTGGADLDGDADLPDLAPGRAITYTATYAITQEDINAGFVLNTATVTATDVYGRPLEDFSDDPTDATGQDFDGDGNTDDPTVAPLPRVVTLEVAKSILNESFSDPFLQAGDTIEYQFVVTNTGNVDIDAVTPTDPGPTFAGVPGTGAALVFATTDDTDLGPAEFATFTATYTLTAADVANFYTATAPAIAIANTASATGTPPTGTSITATPDDEETGQVPDPSIVLTKAITNVADANGNGILGDAGDTVTYDLVVTNTGNTSLASIGITDAKLGLTDEPLNTPTPGAALAPGQSGSITGQVYTITPLDLAEGEVENTADVAGTPVATNTDGTPDAATSLEDATGTPLADVNDTSDTLTEPEAGNPGAVETVGDPAADGEDTPTVVELPTVSADITITKRVDVVSDTNANGIIGDAGDEITYTLTVTNTGTTALADVIVTDAKLGLTQTVSDLAIGASDQITGLTYTITIMDQGEREVVNTANVTGDPVATGPGNVPNPASPLVDDTNADLADVTDISDTLTEPDIDGSGNVEDVADPDAGGNVDDPTVVNLPATGPGIELTKAITDVADTNGNGILGDAGDTITYGFTVTNIGNSSLAGITITDVTLGIAGAAPTPDNLVPGESATLTGETYVITPADQGVGQVENTATTEGQPVATDPVTDRPDPTSPLEDDMGNTLPPVDDTSDTRTDPDLDGSGDPVTTADPDADGDDDAPTLLNIPVPAPAIELTKAITAVNDVNGNNLFGDTEDTIEYALTITNTGNTALAGIIINDAKLGLTNFSPTPDALPVGGSVTFPLVPPYEVTADDQGLGRVENTADVAGTPVATDGAGNPDPTTPLLDDMGDPLNPVTDISDTRTDPDESTDGTVTTTADPDADGDDDAPTILNLPATGPRIELTKAIAQVIDVNGNNLFGDVGDTIIYDFTVTNTGNSALADIVIDDPKLGLTNAAVLDQTLLPGESTTLNGTPYTVTAFDQGVGEVENTADVTGTAVSTDAGGQPDPTTPLLDDAGDPLPPVTDTSDTRTDPDESTDGTVVTTADPNADGDTDAPTLLDLPEIAPEIELTKFITSVADTNNNGLFGDVGDVITYDFGITNTGNTSLVDVVINDAKLGLVDMAVDDQELAPGDTTVLTGQTYTITAADQGAGEVVNTAEVSGIAVATDPAGNPDPATPLLDASGDPLDPVTDISDTRTDRDESTDGTVVTTADPDADGNDHAPTILDLPATEPAIALLKSIVQVNDLNGNGLFGDVGDEVIYDFAIENTGNTSLVDVVINDPKLGLVDVAVDDQELAPGDTTVLIGQSYIVTAVDQGLGELVNTATVSGTAVATDPAGNPDPTTPLLDDMGDPLDPVTDISDTRTDPDESTDGTVTPTVDPDADGNDDAPTILDLPVVEPSIALTKAIREVVDENGNGLFGDIGDTIIYDFEVTNTGNTSLSGVTISDPKLGLVDVAVDDQELAPGDTTVLTGQEYTVIPADQAEGEIVNTATTSGTAVATDAAGEPDPSTPLLDETGEPLDPVTDISDTLTDPDLSTDGTVTPTADPDADGNPDAPTILTLPDPIPGITLVKSVVEVLDTPNDLVLGNVGDTIVYSFIVTNSGETALANITVSDPLLGLVDAPVSPTELMPGETATLSATYVITEEVLAAGMVENTATTAGDPVATGPDGRPDDTIPLVDDTGNPQEPVTDISDTGSEPEATDDGVIIPIDDPAGTGTEDDPTILIIPLVPSDLVISGTVFLDNDRDSVLDPTDDPTGGAGFLVELVNSDGVVVATTTTDANGFYEIEGFPTGTYTVEFTDPDGESAGSLGPLTFTVDVQEIRDVNLPIIVSAPIGELLISKVANVETVVLGQTVFYEIEASNISAADFGPVTVSDTLPQGLSFVPGTATVDGVSVTPDVDGRTINVTGLTLPAGGSVTVTLQALVGAGAPTGSLVNVVNLLDGVDGSVIADPAEAEVIRTPEAVFDCSDVIGKVFDDRNYDGYQNPEPRDGGITNQDIFDEKFGKVQVPHDPEGERGLPRVRLVTPTGTVITTDEHGRYSVPCAELAGRIGTNFTLKLDPTSLPTGYRVTTENPRTMRLTSGIMTEMNFGAALGRVVDVDLTARAFDGDEPGAELRSGLAALLRQVAGTPSVVRISYYEQGEDRETSRERIRATQRLIEELWRDIGRYRLITETTILRAQ